MRIVHIALMGPYTDNWSYQENILPRVQHRQGHQVSVVAPCFCHADGGAIALTQPGEYVLDDGVRVIRLPLKTTGILGKVHKLLLPYQLYPVLCRLVPDLIFLHGLGQGQSNWDIAKYLRRHPNCVLVGDTHIYATLANQGPLKLKSRLVCGYNSLCRKKLYPYYKKVFGITPACVEYALGHYGLPEDKVDLLPLGFDPARCPWEQRDGIRKTVREKYGFAEDDIVIIHGGKIIPRRKTPETIQAVHMLQNPKVKLVIFGGISEEMKATVESLLEMYSDNTVYLGSVTPACYYEAYLASDFALFPGGQSVLWQEAIGCGLPIVVGNDDCLDYLNQGGNAVFLDDTSAEGVYSMLVKILEEQTINEMKFVAQNQAREFFSYERIARLVTDCVE